MEQNGFPENVIVADAAYLDEVSFNLTVNFERMLERRVPPADLPRLVEAMALSAGVKPGEQGATLVILLHDDAFTSFKNIIPASLDGELDGKAFQGILGEVAFSCPAAGDMATMDKLLTDTLNVVAADENVRRIMVVPGDAIMRQACDTLRSCKECKAAMTLFTMQPQVPPGPWQHRQLGFDMLRALGIDSDEIDNKLKQQQYYD